MVFAPPRIVARAVKDGPLIKLAPNVTRNVIVRVSMVIF